MLVKIQIGFRERTEFFFHCQGIEEVIRPEIHYLYVYFHSSRRKSKQGHGKLVLEENPNRAMVSQC
jgi:hypothetical protein